MRHPCTTERIPASGTEDVFFLRFGTGMVRSDIVDAVVALPGNFFEVYIEGRDQPLNLEGIKDEPDDGPTAKTDAGS